jgi:gamma-glutamyltranspeptidase/glutathione hydrolase
MVDAPRILIGASYDPEVLVVHLEEGIDEETVRGLREKGHSIVVAKSYDRAMFGRAQVIAQSWDHEEGMRVWSAGSDCRGDGHAVAY